MKLIRLTAENFMPYKGEMSLSFPLDAGRNVMIVFGDNMRGKTSLLNALRWVFYGRALGRHLREIPLHELHNKEAALEGSWTMEVRIQFEANGHRYDLARRATKRPMVAQPTRPEDFEVRVGMQKDGVALSGHLIDAEINRFVPEQVSRFFLFDGELLQEYETLLIEGSEQGKRIKEAIEQVLGVPTLIHGRDEAATLLRSAQKQQTKDVAHVAGLQNKAQLQASWQSKLETFETDLKTLRDKVSQTKAERSALDDELEKVDAVHLAKMRFDFLRKQQAEIVERQKSLTEERLVLLRDAWRDLLQPKLVVKQKLLTEEQRQIAEQMDRRSKLEGRALDLRRFLETALCPTCGQPMHESRRAEAGRELGEVELALRRMPSVQSELARVSACIQEISQLLRTGVGSRLRAIEADGRRLGVDLTRAENESEKLSEEIRGFDTAEIARKRTLRDGLLREEGQLERDITLVQKRIDDAKKELTIIAKSLQNVPQARAMRSTAMVEICSALERAFYESIERLRDNLRRHVEERATEAFRKLTTQKAYQRLEINNNYGLSIIDERGARVTVRSAGAEQIVALSLIDGLARTGRAAGPVVMDTPFGRLDLQHRDNILKYLPSTTSQLVLLVHSGEIRRKTDLAVIADRIGAAYEIREVNARHSIIDRVTS